uniref:Adipose-secreted signaling protein n=1 Tax=Lotharella globosa TaxID=91324 RepID=A0A6U3ATN8_9EUKA
MEKKNESLDKSIKKARGISFAKDVNFKPAGVSLKKDGQTLTANLGFMVAFSTYEVRLEVEELKKIFPDSDTLDILTSQCKNTEAQRDKLSFRNEDLLYVTITTLEGNSDVKDMVIVREAKLKNTVAIFLLAKVLKKTQGKPLLKDGVRCTSLHKDQQTDAETDFEGFDDP